MLQFIEPSGEATILPLGSYSFHSSHVTTPSSPYIVWPLIQLAILFNRLDQSVSTLKGEIDTQPSKYLVGENDCHHMNYDGVLYSLSSMTQGFYSETVTYQDKVGGVKQTVGLLAPLISIRESPLTSIYSYNWLIPWREEMSFYTSNPSVNNPSVYLDGGFMTLFLNGKMYVGQCVTGEYNNYRYGTYVQFFCIEWDYYQGTRAAASAFIWLKEDFRSLTDLKYHLMQYVASYSPAGPFYAKMGVGVYFTRPSTDSNYARVTKLLSLFADCATPDPIINWSDLSYDCCSQLQAWNSNGLALSKEIIGLGKEISNILHSVKNLLNPKQWSSIFLSAKYGLKLTVTDSIDLLRAISVAADHLGPAKVSSSATINHDYCQTVVHYSIYYEQYADVVHQLMYKLSEFDFLPDLTNMWDLIPYTFVLDWFVDVGGLLDRLDACNRLCSYDIKGDMRSVKTVRQFPASMIGLPGYSGLVTITKYVRESGSSAVIPSIRLDIPIKNGFDHFIESGALILQKILF